MQTFSEWLSWSERLIRDASTQLRDLPVVALAVLSMPLFLALWSRSLWFAIATSFCVLTGAVTLYGASPEFALALGAFSGALCVAVLGVSQRVIRDQLTRAEGRLVDLETRLAVFFDALDARTRLVDERAEQARSALEAASRGFSNIVQRATISPDHPPRPLSQSTPERK